MHGSESTGSSSPQGRRSCVPDPVSMTLHCDVGDAMGCGSQLFSQPRTVSHLLLMRCETSRSSRQCVRWANQRWKKCLLTHLSPRGMMTLRYLRTATRTACSKAIFHPWNGLLKLLALQVTYNV